MKNRNLAIFAPLLLIVCALGVMLVRESYSAPVSPIASSVDESGLVFSYIRRNMLSHHKIKNNNSEGSGTILIKSGDRNSVDGVRKIVYCAHKGKTIKRANYKKVAIENSSVDKLRNAKESLTAIMGNSYPYISISELKTKIKSGIGDSEYTQYGFDKLDAQEAMTAAQAAIWNAIDNNGKKNSVYDKTVTRLLQGSGRVYSFQFFHDVKNKQWNFNWEDPKFYNITEGCYNGTGENHSCGSKSTYLAPGDTTESVASFNNDSTVGPRINRLIDWYYGLKDTGGTFDTTPNFTTSDISWTNEGSTLTVTLLANNDKFTFSQDNKFNASFKDSNGSSLVVASKDPVMLASKTIGYKFVINNITTKSVLVDITAVIPSSNTNVYIYETTNGGYNNSQYFIGAESGDVSYNQTLSIANNAKSKVYIYKTANANGSSTPVITYDGKKDNICGSGNPCQEGAKLYIYSADKKTIMRQVETETTPTEVTLPIGTYYIQEVEAPVGYTYDSNLYEFKIDSDSTVVAVHYNNIPTKICVKKVSSTDKSTVIDGAKFDIEGMLGGVYVNFTTAAQEGMYCTTEAQLPEGVYYLVETEAPANFTKTNKVYRFTVGNFSVNDLVEEVVFDDNTVVEDITLTTVDGVKNVAVIENKPGTVITKSDLATGECVEGAHLTIKDSKGDKVDEWVSSCEDGKDDHTVELQEGKYTLVEEIAPDGYATSESIEFEIDKDGKVNKSLDMKDAPINACFKKVSGSKEGIAGAEFTIYDSNKKVYKTFTSTDGEVCFQYMPVGKYTLEETKAPEGYEKLKNPINIEIKDTSTTQTFKINNETIAEKTAQNSSQIVIIIASIFMIFGLGLVGYYGYKKQK